MSSPRILVVDDEPSVLMTMAANLELDGFTVVEASSGEQALELFAAQPFDLVLSDIRMPGMSGLDLLRRLRELKSDAAVVLMTAFALESVVQDALGEGVFAVLPKPCDLKHVAATLFRAARRPLVLVVDDVRGEAESVAEALCSAGVSARAVFDGASAVAAVARGDVDVCVTDLVMPGMDGAELVDRIRDTAPQVTLIPFSGYSVPEMMSRAAARGSFVCLRKPVDPRELVRLIARARGAAPVSEGR
jgi:CheY-like chemotaxis protein